MPIERGLAVTDDTVLGGTVRLRQPKRGHRAGHDAILLAAAVPARSGQRAVDLGAGAGTAGLVLAARVRGVSVTLIERDPELARLAAENVESNGFGGRMSVLALDVTAPGRAFAAAGLAAETADHVLMNPPFNDGARQRSSPDAQRKAAHVAPPALLASWLRCANRLLRPSGTLTLIWRADGLVDVLAALASNFGGVTVLPIHPKPDRAAIRIVVHALKASRAPLVLLPGFILADADGAPTPHAAAVLRGAPLKLVAR